MADLNVWRVKEPYLELEENGVAPCDVLANFRDSIGYSVYYEREFDKPLYEALVVFSKKSSHIAVALWVGGSTTPITLVLSGDSVLYTRGKPWRYNQVIANAIGYALREHTLELLRIREREIEP